MSRLWGYRADRTPHLHGSWRRWRSGLRHLVLRLTAIRGLLVDRCRTPCVVEDLQTVDPPGIDNSTAWRAGPDVFWLSARSTVIWLATVPRRSSPTRTPRATCVRVPVLIGSLDGDQCQVFRVDQIRRGGTYADPSSRGRRHSAPPRAFEVDVTVVARVRRRWGLDGCGLSYVVAGGKPVKREMA